MGVTMVKATESREMCQDIKVDHSKKKKISDRKCKEHHTQKITN